jgi:hypothetical protein
MYGIIFATLTALALVAFVGTIIYAGVELFKGIHYLGESKRNTMVNDLSQESEKELSDE